MTRSQMKKNVEALKDAVNSIPHLKIKIASYFGFRSTNAIDQWICRNKIPDNKQKDIIRLINQESEIYNESTKRR